jgi:hypothetical protein
MISVPDISFKNPEKMNKISTFLWQRKIPKRRGKSDTEKF